jgi:Transmembrane domain of unknown function (DUF3566)
MTDGRTDDTKPLPRRTLSGASNPNADARRPLSERVSAAIATAGQPVQTGGAAPDTRVPPVTRPPAPSRHQTGAQPIGERLEDPAATSARATRPGRTRRARLRLTHLDPWSVMKTAFLLSVAIGVVTVVAVAVVWGILGVAGVWDSINKTVVDVIGGNSSDTFDIRDYLGTSRVMGFTMIVAVIDVVLITAIATLGAFLYNLSAALLGGLEVTLTEDD